MQFAQRLSGRGQGPTLLDLLQERQMHDYHGRHAGSAATHDRQDPRTRYRKPANSVRAVPMRVLRPRQDPNHERLAEILRRKLHYPEDGSPAVDTARSASLHG